MYKKAIIFIFATLLSISFAKSQNHIDALRYSTQYGFSTAKSSAMGNSLSAVGADLSVTSSNPAGLGVFKNSQLTFTPNLVINTSQGEYAGNTVTENKAGFSVTNFGFVGAKQKENGLLKQISFAVNYNRTAQYTQDIIVSGINNSSSIIDYFVYNSNSLNDDVYGDRWSIFRENLAYETYLTEWDEANSEYFSFVTDDGRYGENQQKSVSKKGGAGLFDFSFAGNINDFLYFGGTIGFAAVHFEQVTDYEETGYADIYAESTETPGLFVQVNPLSMNFREYLISDGNGVTFKFGLIIQPLKFIRIGAAIHSPTYYTFTDDYNTNMNTEFASPDGNGDFDHYFDSDLNTFSWKLRTPFRANAGIAFILEPIQLGKFYTVPLTLSVDYDFIDYSRSHLKAYDFEYSFTNENNQIETAYGQSHSVKTGLELNFGLIKLRGGFQVYSSPYKNAPLTLKNSTSAYSGGIGFGKEHAYIDLSYTYMFGDETLYMYGATENFPLNPIGNITEPAAEITSVNQFFQVTMGLRF